MNAADLQEQLAELRNDLRNERRRNAEAHKLLVKTGDHLEEAMNQAYRDSLFFHGTESGERFSDLSDMLESIAGALPYEFE